MSDGGYEIDEMIKKKRGMTTIRSPIFNKRTGNLVSYPDIPIGEEIPKLNVSNLISRSKKNNSVAKISISNKSPLDQNTMSKDLMSRSKKNNSAAKVSIFNKLPLDQDKISRDLISRCLKNSQEMKIHKSSNMDNIANKNPLNDNELPTKRPSIKKNVSLSERLKEGWTKEQLMKQYSLSEEEYEKNIVNIENIKKLEIIKVQKKNLVNQRGR